MIGSQFGTYRILRKLGEGGMGVVYQGVDESLGRPVAIKVLSPEYAANSSLIERFNAEARAQATLNHTNIATLYAFLTGGDQAWMVMEYVDGENFADMILRRGPIPYQEALPLFRQALLGIGYAHRCGIIHRDIKPANIMLSRNGIVKVMDFGIAKMAGSRTLTRTGMQMGTVHYMAPEQVLNQNVDLRTDIYALGVTLYEMLAGQVPFNANTDYLVLNDHVNTPPPPPTKFYPHIPPGLVNGVSKALEKDPAGRFQSAEEFGAALERPLDFSYRNTPGPAPLPLPAPGPAPLPLPQPGPVPGPNPLRQFLSKPLGRGVAAGIGALLLVLVAWVAIPPKPVVPTSTNLTPSNGGGTRAEEHVIQGGGVIDIGGGGSGQGQQNNQDKATPPAQDEERKPPSRDNTERPEPPTVIPAGTRVAVLTIDAIDGGSTKVGFLHAVSVDGAIVIGGRTVIPHHALARVRVVEVKSSGRFVGKPMIGLELASVTLNGVAYRASSNVVEVEGKSRGKLTAKVIGGGAAVGGALGGIIGRKGKTAAAGAAAGAGAGAAIQGVTGGDDVRLPSELRLVFSLRSPISVR